MAQTAAHLADHVIPPVPVRQWVISVPKRLRGMLADRPLAVAALTKIFLTEIERLLLTASGGAPDAETPGAPRPRLGGISFLHRFGSALNHHVHLHACVTDGVFVPAAAEAGLDAPPTFLPARPVAAADLAALTERVRRRVIRFLPARSPARRRGRRRQSATPTAASSASATCCPGTKPPTGSGGVAGGSPHGRAPAASSSSHRLSFSTGSPISCRRRGSIGIATMGCLRRITSSGGP